MDFPAHALRDLPAQDHAPLLLDKTAFGESGLTDELLEPRAVELAIEPAEIGIAGDAAGDLGIADAEPQGRSFLIERRLGHQLAEQLPVDAARTRLLGRDRLPQLAADLLQAVGIELTELLGRNFGLADLDCRIEPEAAENVADAPDREADDQSAHNRRP